MKMEEELKAEDALIALIGADWKWRVFNWDIANEFKGIFRAFDGKLAVNHVRNGHFRAPHFLNHPCIVAIRLTEAFWTQIQSAKTHVNRPFQKFQFSAIEVEIQITFTRIWLD